jgi:hypothetical protein
MPEMPDGHGAAFSSSLAILEGRLRASFLYLLRLHVSLPFPSIIQERPSSYGWPDKAGALLARQARYTSRRERP